MPARLSILVFLALLSMSVVACSSQETDIGVTSTPDVDSVQIVARTSAFTPTVTAVEVPTPTATPRAAPTPTAIPRAAPTPTATPRAAPTPTATPRTAPTPTATPRAAPTPTATPRAAPTPTATPRTAPTPTATPRPFFTLGSNRDQVFEVQGDPNAVGPARAIVGGGDTTKEVWYYGEYDFDDRVVFSRETGLVIAWDNSGGTLNVGIVPGPNTTANDFFVIGSHQDDVARLQGAPDYISLNYWGGDSLLDFTWYYDGLSTVTFSLDGIVQRWINKNQTLKIGATAGPNVTTSHFFSIGSHRDDVIRLQGSPFDIYFVNGSECFEYSNSVVRIERSSETVAGWHNAGELKVEVVPGIHVTNSQFFTLGSHQDDVARIQGTPLDVYMSWNSCRDSGNRWRYGGGNVNFDSQNRVVGWEMSRSAPTSLKVKLEPGPQVTTEDYFTISSTEDDVIRIQGTPTTYDVFKNGYMEFRYGRSKVVFDPLGLVWDWEDNDNNLKARRYAPK